MLKVKPTRRAVRTARALRVAHVMPVAPQTFGVYKSTEAMDWYHGDNGALAPPNSRKELEGLPWRKDRLERSHVPTSAFTGLGVPPPEASASRKANLPRLRWSAKKRSGSFATELLPHRPAAMVASLAGGLGSNPVTEDERRAPIWFGRPAQQAPRPVVMDPIHGVPKAQSPRTEELDWVTTYTRGYTDTGAKAMASKLASLATK